MPAEDMCDAKLWWMIKPKEPSQFAKILEKMRIRRIPHGESGRGSVLAAELNTVENADLREALGRQALSRNTHSLLIPVANHDGTLSHTNSVPIGELRLVRPSSYENN